MNGHCKVHRDEWIGEGRCDLCTIDALRAELAALREDPRLKVPLDGPGSHRLDLQEQRALRRDLAALREECEYWREKFPRVERETREARALLAEVTFWLEEAWGRNDDETLVASTKLEALGAVAWDAIQNARAFLRRDDVCEPGNCNQPRGHRGPCPVWTDEPARDEARRGGGT